MESIYIFLIFSFYQADVPDGEIMSSVVDSKETEAIPEDPSLLIMDCGDKKSESWQCQKTVRKMQLHVICIFILLSIY